MGITPKFRSRSDMAIVSQIFSQSAKSCSLRKRTARGTAVVPEVNFNKAGGFALHFPSVEAALLSGKVFQEPPGTVATTAVARQIFNAFSLCSSLSICSNGKTTICLRKQARNSDGQSG